MFSQSNCSSQLTQLFDYDDRIGNLIDVAMKLASDNDPQYHIPQFNKPDIIIPHLTPWAGLSYLQKLEILHLTISSYRASVLNSGFDKNEVDPAFIKNRHLRKKSTEYT